MHDAHTASDAPHATDSKTKARVNAAIASVSKLANGHMTLKSDPDREGLPNQAVGDTANSRSSNPPDALALMPDIPPGMVSPDDGSQQQQAGYGESSTSEDSSAGSGDEEEEPAEAVPDQDWAGHEEEQGVRAQAPNGQASHANGEGGAQGAISSDSFRPSSSSDDEDAVQQQPDQEGKPYTRACVWCCSALLLLNAKLSAQQIRLPLLGSRLAVLHCMILGIPQLSCVIQSTQQWWFTNTCAYHKVQTRLSSGLLTLGHALSMNFNLSVFRPRIK